MSEIVGGCLCGQVRYSSKAEPLMTAICHCRDCQKQTGTSFSLVLGVPRAALETTGTLSVFDTQGESGARVHRHFCGTCGSPIYSAADSFPELVFLKAGTLDDPSWLSPQTEFWCDTAQPWVHAGATLPRIPRNPPAG